MTASPLRGQVRTCIREAYSLLQFPMQIVVARDHCRAFLHGSHNHWVPPWAAIENGGLSTHGPGWYAQNLTPRLYPRKRKTGCLRSGGKVAPAKACTPDPTFASTDPRTRNVRRRHKWHH